ncbi:hypothetical protein V6N12_069956 [Hibiscus sabdariffa]|uniref:Uncharacterized protein n=1 Tax=Hibiscus sabdariffa TaxID=183260 RepID=A0ABR2FFC7_9ROSI
MDRFNLAKGQVVISGLNWEILFGVLLCNIWRRENEMTFEPNIAYRESVFEKSLQIVQNMGTVQTTYAILPSHGLWESKHWMLPSPGLHKLNIHGLELATVCGGVVRNDTGS